MLLMAVVIIASIIGTIIESGFNAAVAQAYVYDAPWFYVWLFLLCVNLIAAVVAKYPWQPHQYGFVITHAAIVIMLAGAVVGRIWGVEGNITISNTAGPQNFLVVNDTLLQVRQPNYPVNTFSLPLNLRNPSSERPFKYDAGDISVEVLDVANELGIREVVEPATGGGVPAFRLVMTGAAAPHPIDRWLLLDHGRRGTLSLGSNHVHFASVKPGLESQDCCPSDDPPEESPASGTDECCDDGPSLVVDADAGAAGPVDAAAVQPGGMGNNLWIRFDDGQLSYQSEAGDTAHSGRIVVGEAFCAGWDGWTFKVEELIEQATLREELAPMAAGGMRATGASGIYIRLDDGSHQAEKWLRMGAMSGIRLGNRFIHASFGFRLHPLDFTVDLERFEVEFNPGTRTPASFKSHVIFTSESGEQTRRAVWMNNPTNYPDFPGVGLLGTSYKFSQSSWNPGDLSQTTLQVIRDPGWSLKWIGSLLFCLGLLMIFYLKPYPRFARNSAGSSSKESDAAVPQPSSTPAPAGGTLQRRRAEMVLK